MTVATADRELRAAIRQRLEVEGPGCSEATKVACDYVIDLAIERLVLAALVVGRPVRQMEGTA